MWMLPVASLRSYVMLSAEDAYDFAFPLDCPDCDYHFIILVMILKLVVPVL
jgi:hypothetical protein